MENIGTAGWTKQRCQRSGVDTRPVLPNDLSGIPCIDFVGFFRNLKSRKFGPGQSFRQCPGGDMDIALVVIGTLLVIGLLAYIVHIWRTQNE